MNKQTWLVVVFVVLAVAIGFDQLIRQPKTPTITVSTNNSENSSTQVTVEATSTTPDGSTTVTNKVTQKTVPTETELKDVRFCVAKNVQECKVCLTPKCTPPTGGEVTCYTQTSNCAEGKNQRRLSRSEVAHFDQIVEHNFTW